MSDSSQSRGLQPPRLLRSWDFPGKSTGVGCHCLLQKEYSYKGVIRKTKQLTFHQKGDACVIFNEVLGGDDACVFFNEVLGGQTAFKVSCIRI